ncbi:MAG TPA: Rieske (2Fe-2S) protein, partial [Chloroflexota bacterium]
AESSCLRSIGLEHLEIEYTGYGYRIGAMTPEGEQQSVRVSQVILPCYTYVAEARGGDILFHAWVPRDDSSCWTWDIWFNEQKPIDAHEHMNRRGVWVDENFRKLRNLDNEWMQDREAMRNKSFSGIYGILTQDQAIQESMGPVYDRGREHLGTTDLGVLALRKVLLEAVQAVASGDEPTTRASRGRLDGLRSEQLTIPVDASWREACPLPSEFALT